MGIRNNSGQRLLECLLREEEQHEVISMKN